MTRIDGYWLLLLALIAYGLIFVGQTIKEKDFIQLDISVFPKGYLVESK